jgi:hypothetical protein
MCGLIALRLSAFVFALLSYTRLLHSRTLFLRWSYQAPLAGWCALSGSRTRSHSCAPRTRHPQLPPVVVVVVVVAAAAAVVITPSTRLEAAQKEAAAGATAAAAAAAAADMVVSVVAVAVAEVAQHLRHCYKRAVVSSTRSLQRIL